MQKNKLAQGAQTYIARCFIIKRIKQTGKLHEGSSHLEFTTAPPIYGEEFKFWVTNGVRLRLRYFHGPTAMGRTEKHGCSKTSH